MEYYIKFACTSVCVCMRARARVCVCGRVCACVCACVRACVQYQSVVDSEEFKIASFVSMVDGCSVIGVPHSSAAGHLSSLLLSCCCQKYSLTLSIFLLKLSFKLNLFHFLMPVRRKCGVCHFFTKSVAMATFLEISKKVVQIDYLHPKRFHLVKRLRKSVQWILR